MTTPDLKQLIPLLDPLAIAVEDLLLAGLTAASKSTIERLDVCFKEASRMKLLRLGSTLRIANEEISRFISGSPQFSTRRLVFFLGRAWLLTEVMRKAIKQGDQNGLDRLLVTPPTQPLKKLTVVTLGVAKRVVPGAFASFDFRLRAVQDAPPIMVGEPIIWSCVFPLRKDLDLPVEAFLHLPQKQKFKPSLLLEKKQVEVTNCAISQQPGGQTRLMLGESSTVTTGTDFDAWEKLLSWELLPAAERLQQHRPTPLDLEIELQEDVFIARWQLGTTRTTDQGYDLLPIETEHLPFEVRLDHGPSGEPVRGVFDKLATKKRRPALYGMAHYEACRIIFQPLSAWGAKGLEYLTINPEKISQAELVKAMKFT